MKWRTDISELETLDRVFVSFEIRKFCDVPLYICSLQKCVLIRRVYNRNCIQASHPWTKKTANQQKLGFAAFDLTFLIPQ
jgi:hypothetical protein